MTNQSQPPGNQAAARESRLTEIARRLNTAKVQIANDKPVRDPTWADVQHLLSLLQQPATGERYLACVLCGHLKLEPWKGICEHQVFSNNGEPCGCKCVYPATGAAVNTDDALDKAARIAYDMIVSGRSAKEVSIAIHALKVAATSAGEGGGQWQVVNIPAGNPNVVAIRFETPEAAARFIERWAKSSVTVEDTQEPNRFRDLCRSALAIARREGRETNWASFVRQLEDAFAATPPAPVAEGPQLCETCVAAGRVYCPPEHWTTPSPCPKCGHSTWRQNKSLLTWFNCETCLYRENVLTEEVGGGLAAEEAPPDDGDCAIGCGCPDDPWRKPSTATTSEAANAAATEICDYCGIDTNDAEKVAAIISRHLPNAGEVERLIAERDAWRRGAMLLLDELGDYEPGRAPHVRVRHLKRELAST
jgi:hypothetical protein